MGAYLALAYKLLSDLQTLEDTAVLDQEEMAYLLSSKLSHKFSKNFFGRYYLRYYYAPMIVSALTQFEKGHFLELGCGTGTQVILAKHMGFEHASGIDMIPERITIAKKRASFYKVQNAVSFNVEDFWKLKLERKADAIYSMFAFELFFNPPLKACEQLATLCSEHATIILDMGCTRFLNSYKELMQGFSQQGFSVKLESLIPGMVNTGLARFLGKRNAWSSLRAVRLIASR